MLIFHLLRDLFRFSYYRDVLAGTRRFNFFLSILILSLLSVIIPAITIYTQGFVLAQNFETQTRTLIERLVPEELEIRIKDGVASTNVQEPYYITVSPDDFKGTFLEDKERTSTYDQRLLAIDTKGRAEDFERYQSAALLTERSFVYYDDGNIEVQSLREMDDLVLNKLLIETKMNELFAEYKVGDLIRIGVLTLPVLLLVMLYIGYSFLILFYALLVLIMMKIVRANSSYGRAVTYTAAVMFIPYVFAIAVSMIPGLPVFIVEIFDYKWLIILAFAYGGIHYLHSDQEAAK
jgi:Protein of unknown function (DUF1189)